MFYLYLGTLQVFQPVSPGRTGLNPKTWSLPLKYWFSILFLSYRNKKKKEINGCQKHRYIHILVHSKFGRHEQPAKSKKKTCSSWSSLPREREKSVWGGQKHTNRKLNWLVHSRRGYGKRYHKTEYNSLRDTSVCGVFFSTCVNAQWVEVLHVADSDAVISDVSHHLIFHLLPAQQRLLHQDLTAHGQSLYRKSSV